MRDHGLMYVLSAIVLLNIIAIVILGNRIAPSPQQPPAQPIAQQPQTPPPVVISPPRPLVRTLIFEDKVTCPDCYDIRQYTDQLTDILNLSLEQGNPSAFHLTRLPALAFNQSLELYPGSY